MSCHSTPANVALLGYGAHAAGLSANAVETEFHWLKKIGKSRAALAPTAAEWTELLLQREQWIRHDPGLSQRKREASLARLADSYEQVPDGPTYYALSNLPARLSQVTAPETVMNAAERVQEKVTRMAAGPAGKDDRAMRTVIDGLSVVCQRLKVSLPEQQDESAAAAQRMVEGIQRADLGRATRSDLYHAAKGLLATLALRG